MYLTLRTALDNVVIMVIPSLSATVIDNKLDWEELCEYPRATFKKIYMSNNNDRQSTRHIGYGVSTKNIFRGTAYTNDNFSALIGANPARQFYLHFMIINQNGADIQANIFDIQIRLTQHVDLFIREKLDE